MAHLALYRAFRPTTLTDVVRQEHIVTVLKNQIESNRVGHAYLFCGPRGTGKTSVAKIFAAAINCESPVNGSPCGQCEACRALKDPSNLDITEIDAASNNGVDEMRELREKVQYPPVAGRYKVYVVDEVHMLSTGAFNALLKTLEEPPAHAVFILATTESQKIPATILSRCMRFDFKLIPQADLEERLRYVFKEIGKAYDEEAISAIARAGAGSVRDMLSVADTCVSYSTGKLTYADVNAVLGNADFSEVGKLCKSILEGDSGGAFARTESFLSAGKSVGMLLKDVLNFLNACTVAKTCRDGQAILALPKEAYSEVLTVSKATDGHGLLRATEIFAKVESEVKYSTSPRILFETAVMKASLPKEDYDIESLLTRIAALEKKIEEGITIASEGGRVATNAGLPVASEPIKAEEPPVEEYAEIDVPPDMDAPPEEGETGGYAYFDSVVKPAPKKETVPTPAPAPAPVARAAKAVRGDSKATFGSFMRSIRKTAKNGVLVTLCMDLDGEYDGDVFALYTESDTVYRSLKQEKHIDLITQAFESIGMGAQDFDVRLRTKPSDAFGQGVAKLKETFGDIKIEIK